MLNDKEADARFSQMCCTRAVYFWGISDCVCSPCPFMQNIVAHARTEYRPIGWTDVTDPRARSISVERRIVRAPRTAPLRPQPRPKGKAELVIVCGGAMKSSKDKAPSKLEPPCDAPIDQVTEPSKTFFPELREKSGDLLGCAYEDVPLPAGARIVAVERRVKAPQPLVGSHLHIRCVGCSDLDRLKR